MTETTDKIWHKITRRDTSVQEKIDAYIESLRPKSIEEYKENGIVVRVYESR